MRVSRPKRPPCTEPTPACVCHARQGPAVGRCWPRVDGDAVVFCDDVDASSLKQGGRCESNDAPTDRHRL